MLKFPIGNALPEMEKLACLQTITFNMYKLEANATTNASCISKNSLLVHSSVFYASRSIFHKPLFSVKS